MRKKLVLGLLWIGLALASLPLRQAHDGMIPARPAVRIQDVLLDLLGEGRTVLARLLWFKMDMMHEQQDDQGVATFQQKELVPLLRMITYLDPQFVDAYDTLAYELHKGYDRTDEAIVLIDEGLKFNPNSFELNFRRAFLSESKKDWPNTLMFANVAYRHAGDELQRLAALRTLLRCAISRDDAQMGLQVLDAIRKLGPAPQYESIYRRWQNAVPSSR